METQVNKGQFAQNAIKIHKTGQPEEHNIPKNSMRFILKKKNAGLTLQSWFKL